MISIHYFKDVDKSILKDSIFITGFQGFGMVGYLSSRHIVQELGLSKVAFIKTRYMPEIIFYTEKHGIIYPFELYYGVVNGKKITVLLNNATPIERERTEYAEFIAKWSSEIGVSKCILIGGLDPSIKTDPSETYRWIPIGESDIKLNAPILSEKYVIGPLALTMMFMNAYNIPGVAIFAYTELYRPDPRASAVAVEVVGQILDVSISTKKLIEEATIIEAIEEERKKIISSVEGEVKSEKPRYSMHV